MHAHHAKFHVWLSVFKHLVPKTLQSLLLLAGVLSGCSNDSFGRFDAPNPAQHELCLEAMFPFEPSFLTARVRQGSVGLFMQGESGPYRDQDLVYIEIFDQESLTHSLAAPGDFEASAIAEVEWMQTCPDVVESLYVAGSLNLDSLETGDGGIVSGTIDGQLMSRRSGEFVSDFNGDFFIEVQKGPPYEEFY